MKSAKDWVASKIKGGSSLKAYAGFSISEIRQIQADAVLWAYQVMDDFGREQRLAREVVRLKIEELSTP